MKNITNFPQKFREMFQATDRVNPRTWQEELRFKATIQRELGKIIHSVHSLDQWYRSSNIDGYASEVQICVNRLDKQRIYYRNCYIKGGK